MSLLVPDYNPTASMKGMGILILDAQTVDETLSKVVCPSPGVRNHTISIIANDAPVTGAVQIETSNDPNYAGVWSPLGGGPIDLSTIDGMLELQFSNILITALRVRISTVVASGSVSAVYTAGA